MRKAMKVQMLPTHGAHNRPSLESRWREALPEPRTWSRPPNWAKTWEMTDRQDERVSKNFKSKGGRKCA